MKTINEQIIEKQDEIIKAYHHTAYSYKIGDWAKIKELKDELSALKAQAEKELQNIPNNSQIRNELYEKVYVRSEADLPKIEDVYYVHIKPDNKVIELCFHKDVSHQNWLKYIDWYLRPVDAEQEKVTDELVFKWLKDRKYQTSYGEQEYKMYFDVDMPKIIREAINHFTIEKVTDEDIDYFMCEVIFSQFDSYWDAMKYGAKAMRDGLITHNK